MFETSLVSSMHINDLSIKFFSLVRNLISLQICVKLDKYVNAEVKGRLNTRVK